MPNFASPALLLLLLLLPPLIYLYVKRLRRNNQAIPFSTTSTELKNLRYSDNLISHIPFILRLAALTSLILALSRPQIVNKNEDAKMQGINIILTLDVSNSMSSEDIKPNRLEGAKAIIEQFIQKRVNDRMGLIVYGKDAYLKTPLTVDHSLLIQSLQEVRFYDEITTQTAIGNALALSVQRIKDVPHKSKVVILLTDGDNNAGEIAPLSAAQLAQAFGVKVYTVGIGQPGYSTAPYTVEDPLFGKITRQRTSFMDETLLKEIAEKTGGLYFNAQSRDGLEKAYNQIDQYEKVTIKNKDYFNAFELFPFFIGLAFLLILFRIVLVNSILRILP